MTYEQAYRKCKAQIDVNFPPGSSQTAGRNSAGAACMHDLGFLPKKSRNSELAPGQDELAPRFRSS